MKAIILLFILNTLVLTSKIPKLLKSTSLNKNKQIENSKTPDDIKKSQIFLKNSAKEFNAIKNISATTAIQNSITQQNLDLTIPHIENQMPLEPFTLTRKLDQTIPADKVLNQSLALKKADSKTKNKADTNLTRKLDEDEEDEEDDEEDEKLDDVEKRLYSIEDKIDHLLLHTGHDISPHQMIMTPWGPHIAPAHTKNSINHKLRMVDHIINPYVGMGMGHMGHMGHMGMGMGLGYHHHAHSMGLGHANPYGYGLGHLYGGPYGHYGYGYGSMYHPYGHHGYGGYGSYHNPYGRSYGSDRQGGLGYGYNDDSFEDRERRYDRHNDEMDRIINRPAPFTNSFNPHLSSSSFLI